jgi:hypothetical protein
MRGPRPTWSSATSLPGGLIACGWPTSVRHDGEGG